MHKTHPDGNEIIPPGKAKCRSCRRARLSLFRGKLCGAHFRARLGWRRLRTKRGIFSLPLFWEQVPRKCCTALLKSSPIQGPATWNPKARIRGKPLGKQGILFSLLDFFWGVDPVPKPGGRKSGMSWEGMKPLSRRTARALGLEHPWDSLLPEKPHSGGSGSSRQAPFPSLLEPPGAARPFPVSRPTQTRLQPFPLEGHSRGIIPPLFVTPWELLPPFSRHIPLFPKLN